MVEIVNRLKAKARSLLRRAGLNKVQPKVLAGVALLCLVLIVGALWRFWPMPAAGEDYSFEASAQEELAAADESNGVISVDVEGAVEHPGLYELAAGSRAGDAVELAGGLTRDALPGAVNLAEVLADGMQLHVPAVGKQASDAQTQPAAGGAQRAGKTNINSASAAELQQLDGIGEVLAQRIVQHREENGLFASVDDIRNVAGIGQARFEAIKDSICV